MARSLVVGVACGGFTELLKQSEAKSKCDAGRKLAESEFSDPITTHFKEIYALCISLISTWLSAQMDLRFLENDIFVEISKIPWLMVLRSTCQCRFDSFDAVDASMPI